MKNIYTILIFTLLSISSYGNNCNLKTRIYTEGKLVNFDNHIININNDNFPLRIKVKGTNVKIDIFSFDRELSLKSSSIINIKTSKRLNEKYGETILEHKIEGDVNSNLISYFNDSKLTSILTCFIND